jgi:hypothetical protein
VTVTLTLTPTPTLTLALNLALTLTPPSLRRPMGEGLGALQQFYHATRQAMPAGDLVR